MLCEVFRVFAYLVVKLVRLVNVVEELPCLVEIKAWVVVLVVKFVDPHRLPDLMQVFCLDIRRDPQRFLEPDIVLGPIERI